MTEIYNQQQSFSTYYSRSVFTGYCWWKHAKVVLLKCVATIQAAESTYRSDISDLDWCLAWFRNVWLCADILSLYCFSCPLQC